MSKNYTLPYHLDTEACIMGFFAVFDRNSEFVAEFDSIDEAEAFIANANVTDIETVREQSAKRSQMLHEHRRNLIRNSKPDEQNNKS